MFVLTLAVFASVALAHPHKRFDVVASIGDLTFTAAITNTNSEAVKILKYGTILDNLPTRSFTVSKDGADVAFTGAKLTVALSDSAYTTIASGETVTVSHTVSEIYDFASAGTGTYSFAPLTEFQVAGAEDSVSAVAELAKVTVAAPSVGVEVTSDVARRVRKRATDICKDSSMASFIDASYTEAKELASISSSYISTNGASDSVYTAYFGASSTSKVTGIIDAVADENDSSRTLSCTDDYNVCDGNVIAYTLISTTDIYFCDIFFDEVPSTSLCSGTTVASRNIRGGTTLHELTHAVADTDDITYGCAADQALSDAKSVQNADNFNCFTTQVYADTQC
ncbi:zincin [Hymenopellis radicata]|nr:zincin [Hymenopellis radicata]